jgi:hypothetical protein
MKPFKTENDIAYFYTSQCDLYGMPEYYGYQNYLVVSDTESPMVYDYQMEQDRKMRPIHRYNRVERFAFTLSQLLGLKGDVSRDIIELVQDNECYDWESIRNLLKEHNLRKYYNRIPYIMKCMHLPPLIKYEVTNQVYHEMIHHFKIIQNRFDKIKGPRKYFPSIRYIVFRMLQDRGAVFDESVPFVRTKRKEKSLNEIWDLLNNVCV